MFWLFDDFDKHSHHLRLSDEGHSHFLSFFHQDCFHLNRKRENVVFIVSLTDSAACLSNRASESISQKTLKEWFDFFTHLQRSINQSDKPETVSKLLWFESIVSISCHDLRKNTEHNTHENSAVGKVEDQVTGIVKHVQSLYWNVSDHICSINKQTALPIVVRIIIGSP